MVVETLRPDDQQHDHQPGQRETVAIENHVLQTKVTDRTEDQHDHLVQKVALDEHPAETVDQEVEQHDGDQATGKLVSNVHEKADQYVDDQQIKAQVRRD